MTGGTSGRTSTCPFPGLRPYRFEESHLFFGRDRQVLDLLTRLRTNRFLAVLGPSGGGKSSLVRAGLLPALHGGFMSGPVSSWEIAQFRPGFEPLEQLKKALESVLGGIEDAVEGTSTAEDDPRGSSGAKKAIYTSRSLVDWATSRGIGGSRGLLVVADQFEEAVRQRGTGSDLLVEMLMAAADQVEIPIYVVVTMRHDYLGECARFPGLPEVLNKSQYLMPSLTREERQEAIEGPLRIADVKISNRLVQALLRESASWQSEKNDQGEIGRRRPGDSLPVLQHALFRTFQRWEEAGRGDEIDLEHYDSAGRIACALGNHANAVVAGLSKQGQSLVPAIFRCLTVADSGRIVRRATSLSSLCDICGTAPEPITEVINAFADDRNCLLEKRSNPDVVDLLHESLIDNWSELRVWALSESKDVDDYVDLQRSAKRLMEGDGAALLRGRVLDEAGARLSSGRLNRAWARLYGYENSFESVRAFIGKSLWTRNRNRLLMVAALVLLAVGIYVGRAAYQEGVRRAADEASREALRSASAQFDEERRLAESKAPGLERDLAVADVEIKALQAQLAAGGALRATTTPDPRDQERVSQLAAALSSAQNRNTDLETTLRNLRAEKQADDSAAAVRVKELETRLSRLDRAVTATPQPSPSVPGPARVACKAPPPNLPWWEYWEQAKASSSEDRAKTVSYLLAAIATGPPSGDGVPKRDQTRDPGGKVPQYFPYRLLAEQFAHMSAADVAACYEAAQPARKN